MGKGEIARYEEFLLFPQCFQKACFQGASKGVIVWEWVKVHSAFLYPLSIYISGKAWQIEADKSCNDGKT